MHVQSGIAEEKSFAKNTQREEGFLFFALPLHKHPIRNKKGIGSRFLTSIFI